MELKKVVIVVDDRRHAVYMDAKDRKFSLDQFLKIYDAFINSEKRTVISEKY